MIKTNNLVMKRGLTLVELLVVMAILGILAAIAVSTLNPIELSNKGWDARRKKDLNRIKVAFEEYFNDKKCYPSQVLINSLRCSTTDFAPWLNSWPCDPSGVSYKILIESGNCPRYFKILTQLQNRNDNQIPAGWYNGEEKQIDGIYTSSQVNFGVSSTNILWTENLPTGAVCENNCYRRVGPGNCDAVTGCSMGEECFSSANCEANCTLSCCGDGCVH